MKLKVIFFNSIFFLLILKCTYSLAVDLPNRGYQDLVSKEGMPQLKVTKETRLRSENLYRIAKINFSERENTILGSNSTDRFNVTCTAPYLTRWTSSILPTIAAFYTPPQRYSHNPLLENSVENLEFNSEFSIVVPGAKSGFIQCESVKNSSMATRVYIYTLDGDQLATAQKFIYSEVQPVIFTDTRQNFIIPCHANYPNVTAIIGDFVNFRKKNQTFIESDESIRIGDYDSQVGFIIRGQENASERYVCAAGKQQLIFHAYNPDSHVRQDEKILFYIGSATRPEFPDGISCETGTEALVDIQMINCDSKFECDWLSNCFEIECKNNGILLKYALLDTKIISHPHPRGKVVCTSYDNIINVAHNYLFTGLDFQLYWLSNYKQVAPKRAIIHINETGRILYTNELARFSCQIMNFVLASNIRFAALFKNGTTLLLDKINSTEVPALSKDSNYGFSRKDIFVYVTPDMIGIMCLAPSLDSIDWVNTSRQFEVRDIQAPMIIHPTRLNNQTNNNNNNNAKNEVIFYEGQKYPNLLCNTTGEPSPRINWIVPDSISKKFPNTAEATLRFPIIDPSVEGKYTCVATNDYGAAFLDYEVLVKNLDDVTSAGLSAPEIVAISAVFVVLVLVVVVLTRKYMNAKEDNRKLTKEIDIFLNGSQGRTEVTSIDMDENPTETVQLNAFNPKFIIASSDLTFDEFKVLGQGHFGKVLLGVFKNTRVAVKIIKSDADVSSFLDHLSELKIMAYVATEKHPNIVEFLGAVVSEIQDRKVSAVVELSTFGSLETFLKRLKQDKYLNLVGPDGHVNIRPPTPVRPCTSTLDFVSWCEQVANGMDFLARKKVIHADLAARNILVFENSVVKISDFGLSRKLYGSLQYNKKSKTALPVAWMAIESLRFMNFSSQSDVWSFGVTVWEIFSTGEFPYAGMPSKDLVKNLLSGYRLERPVYMPVEIYKILLRCWHPEPSHRPSFSELGKLFHDIAASIKETLYGENANQPVLYVEAAIIGAGYVI